MTNYERDIVSTCEYLYSYAKFLTRDQYRADDLFQDTLLRILSSADKYDDRNRFSSWARVVMRNTFYNDERAETTHTRTLIVGYDDIEEPYSLVADSECNYSYAELLMLVNSLPQEQSLLLHRRIAGYKYEEIAEEFGIPVGTVKSQLFAAKNKLKKLMER